MPAASRATYIFVHDILVVLTHAIRRILTGHCSDPKEETAHKTMRLLKTIATGGLGLQSFLLGSGIDIAMIRF